MVIQPLEASPTTSDVVSPLRGVLLALTATALAISAVGLAVSGDPEDGGALVGGGASVIDGPLTLTASDSVLSGRPVASAAADLLPAENRALAAPVSRESILPPLLEPGSFPEGLGVAEPVLPSPVEPEPMPTGSSDPSPSEDPDPGQDSSLTLADYWFVGDSIAVAFHQYIGASADQLSGRVGAGSSEITDSVLPALSDPSSRSERVLLVALGTNDSLGSEPTFERNVGALMAAAENTGRCVVWLTIHRVTDGGTWASYNDVLRTQQSRFPTLRLVDLDAIVSSEPDLLYDDGVHLRPEGYARLWPLVNAAAVDCTTGLG